jgi:hypothetical protein
MDVSLHCRQLQISLRQSLFHGQHNYQRSIVQVEMSAGDATEPIYGK